MAEIDFGKLVSRVLARMDDTESNLTGGESRDTGKALRHYKQALAEEIRRVFDEAETRAEVPPLPTCSHCGAPLGEGYRYCGVCRMPQTTEAAVEALERVFAKDLGRDRYDPLFREALARVKDEAPDQWAALVQKLTVPVKA